MVRGTEVSLLSIPYVSCYLCDWGCAYTQLSPSLSLEIARSEKLTVSTEFQCLPEWKLRSSKLQSSIAHYGSKLTQLKCHTFQRTAHMSTE